MAPPGLESLVLEQVTGSPNARMVEIVATLWAGYGAIIRYELKQKAGSTVIVKKVAPPEMPAGSDPSHDRKLASYNVEMCFYEKYSTRCRCRVPRVWGCTRTSTGGWEFVLEDLDAQGFDGRRERFNTTHQDVRRCLSWLAAFHASFMGVAPEGLWPVGTYWNLGYRQSEYDAMEDSDLKTFANALDARLNNAVWKTVVHGDAKLANFCFGKDSVAALDFQYAGGGAGIRDVAYFLGSCRQGEQLEQEIDSHLDFYFAELRSQLIEANHDERQADLILEEWRGLYPIAVADFQRFLLGWSPRHWKLNEYTSRITAVAIRLLR